MTLPAGIASQSLDAARKPGIRPRGVLWNASAALDDDRRSRPPRIVRGSRGIGLPAPVARHGDATGRADRAGAGPRPATTSGRLHAILSRGVSRRNPARGCRAHATSDAGRLMDGGSRMAARGAGGSRLAARGAGGSRCGRLAARGCRAAGGRGSRMPSPLAARGAGGSRLEDAGRLAAAARGCRRRRRARGPGPRPARNLVRPPAHAAAGRNAARHACRRYPDCMPTMHQDLIHTA
jgi:hypothetical protein